MITAIMLIMIFRILETLGAAVPIWFYIICWCMFAISALNMIIKICQRYIEWLEEKRKKELLSKLEELKAIIEKRRTNDE